MARTRKTSKMKLVEGDYGEPIERVLEKLLTYYDMIEVAELLHVSPVTVYRWCRELGVYPYVYYKAVGV